MSIKILSQVWQHADVSGSELLVLLAMADFCDDQGRNIYPSMPTLAHKARLSESQTRRIVQAFCDNENGDALVEIVEAGGWKAGRNRSNHYRILLDSPKLQPKPKESGITLTPPSELTPPPVEEMADRGGITMTPPPREGGGSIAMTPPRVYGGGVVASDATTVVSSDATTVVAPTRPDPSFNPLSDPSLEGEGASPFPETAKSENSGERTPETAEHSLYAMWQQVIAEVSVAEPTLTKSLAGSTLERIDDEGLLVFRVQGVDPRYAEWVKQQASIRIKRTLGSMVKVPLRLFELEIRVAA